MTAIPARETFITKVYVLVWCQRCWLCPWSSQRDHCIFSVFGTSPIFFYFLLPLLFFHFNENMNSENDRSQLCFIMRSIICAILETNWVNSWGWQRSMATILSIASKKPQIKVRRLINVQQPASNSIDIVRQFTKLTLHFWPTWRNSISLLLL